MARRRRAVSVLAELFVGAADPLNIVASFLPVVPVGSRAATALMRMGPNAGRVARGAIEGGAGAAALEPFMALERGAWDPDHGFGNSVLNVAFGSALGGGLHWFGGRVSDWRRARKLPSPEAPPEAGGVPLNAPPAAPSALPQVMAEAVDRATPQTRETALRVAVAALAQDRRVDVEAVLRSDPAFVPPRIETATSRLALDAGSTSSRPAGDPVGEYRFFQQGLASLAAMRTAELRGDTWRTPVPRDWQPDDALLQQAMRLRRGLPPDRPLPEPQSLSQFVRSRGGIDRASVEAGDARAADLQKSRGLLRGKQPKTTIGDQIEFVMRAALDDGFYPDVKARDEEPDLNQFLDDLAADAHGVRRTYREGDTDVERWRDQQAYFKATAEWLESEGLDLANMRRRDLAWLMQLDSRRQRIEVLASRVDRLTDEESLELRDRLDAELADAVADELAIAKASLADARPGNMVGDGEPLTLADLERINADIERSETAGAGHRRAARQVDAAGNAGGADSRADGVEDAGAARPEEGGPGREGQEAQGVGPAESVEALQRSSADAASDLHADVSASDRIKAEAATPEPDPREEAARLEADYAQQLTDADRMALEAVVKPHEDTIKAVEALAQCRVGGDLPMAPKAAPKGGDA